MKDKYYSNIEKKEFRLNNDPEAQQPLVDFLIAQGLEYLGKYKDPHDYSREHIFSIAGPSDFRLHIYWARNVSSVIYKPDGWDGAFLEGDFDSIREPVVGYVNHKTLAFCLKDREIVKLALPLDEPQKFNGKVFQKNLI